MPDPVNEITFVSRLSTYTRIRADVRARELGETSLIAKGDIEETQRDAHGVVRRCDMRLSNVVGQKLVSGEFKRPEVPEGRDPRSEALISDARGKAIARGLPYYFTCNMAEVVLYEVALHPGALDREVESFQLARIDHSSHVDACEDEIKSNWCAFLDALENRLSQVVSSRPSVTNNDVITLKNLISEVIDESIGRITASLLADPNMLDTLRLDAANFLGFAAVLDPKFAATFRDELRQILNLAVFVEIQKLILYRVLQEAGPRRTSPFNLDPLTISAEITDPIVVGSLLDNSYRHAERRSGNYETVFQPSPFKNIIFGAVPAGYEVTPRAGEVWSRVLAAVNNVSWQVISQNLVGFLYEVLVDHQFRHRLGQFYTSEDVVDVLTTFGIRSGTDVVIDPASGGGSFLRSAYTRKRTLGSQHEEALSEVWGFEITAFAAELSTLSLSTVDTAAPATYPRVFLADFFDMSPGTQVEYEGQNGPEVLVIPGDADCVVGNPPYISYRHQQNQQKILNALATLPRDIALPRFTGKSDEYVWFLTHATRYLRDGGRLGFVVSSAILFSDYGIPLIRFLGRHYKIIAVADSLVERWFPDADTNTALLLLERQKSDECRRDNDIRFIRLRRPLAQLLSNPGETRRRDDLEDLIELMTSAPAGSRDPRFAVNIVKQGDNGGLDLIPDSDEVEEAVADG